MAYVSLPRRLVTLLMISTVMVSCSAEGLVPPAEVDVIGEVDDAAQAFGIED